MVSDDWSHLIGIDVERRLEVADAIEGLGDGPDGLLAICWIRNLIWKPL